MITNPASGERAAGAAEKKPQHLGVGVSWTLAGYAVYMACQWAMLVVVARLGSPEKVGQFALGLAISAPVVLFTNLNLRRIQVTDVDGGFQFADYFGLRLLMNVLALGAIAAIAFGGGYDASAAGVILAMGLAKTIEAASDVLHGVCQKRDRMDVVACSLFLRGISGVGGLALAMATSQGIAFGILNMAVGWAAVFAFHDLPRASRLLRSQGVAERVAPRWTARILGRLVWMALPLGLVTALGSLMSTVPCVLIEKFHGAAALGIYSALAYVHLAGHRIASAMGEAACPRLARHVAAGRTAAFVRVLSCLLGLAAAGGVLGFAAAVFAGRPILSFLYGPEYAGRGELFTGLMIVAGVSAVGNLLDYGLTAMRRFRIQPLIYGGALLLYALLCARLIPAMGLGGAVLALGIVALLQALVTLGILVRGLMTLRRRSVGGTSPGSIPSIASGSSA